MGLCGDDGRAGTGKGRHFRVAEPVRRREQNLIAWIEQHLEQVVDRLLPAVRDHHLFRLGRNRIFNAEFEGDGSTQLWIPGCRSVTGDARREGFLGCLNDERRRIEIRLASTQAADVLTAIAQRFGFGADLQRERGFQGHSPVGKFWRAWHR